MMDLAADLAERLLFAIPKKGRLYDQCLHLLQGADIHFHRKNRLDIALCTNLPLAIVFLPAADIAKFVGEGNVDLGITGLDMIAESDIPNDAAREVIRLGFGKCRLCVQVPVSSSYQEPKDLTGLRIVTSFERLAKEYFETLEKQSGSAKTAINYVSGSVEAACALGLADGIGKVLELFRCEELLI
jgi:ATP phosphoribosyltransferase